jgi:hypothetical protein
MKDLLLTLLHLAVMMAKLCGPGGVRASPPPRRRAAGKSLVSLPSLFRA